MLKNVFHHWTLIACDEITVFSSDRRVSYDFDSFWYRSVTFDVVNCESDLWRSGKSYSDVFEFR